MAAVKTSHSCKILSQSLTKTPRSVLVSHELVILGGLKGGVLGGGGGVTSAVTTGYFKKIEKKLNWFVCINPFTESPGKPERYRARKPAVKFIDIRENEN